MAESEADTLELPPVPNFGNGRPRWAAQRIHPRRIARGHLTQWARLRAWTIAENHPTRGVTVSARVAGLSFGALAVWRTAHQEPRLLAIAAGAYAVTAWRAGRPQATEPEQEPPPDCPEELAEEPTEDDLKRQFLLGIQHLIGDRPGIHVRELYATLQARPDSAHLDDARIRALLVRCGVPTQQIRLGDQGGRIGIKRADVEALLSPAPATAPSGSVDAGQSVVDRPVDQLRPACRPPTTHPQKETPMSSNTHDITIRGRILLPGGDAVACPECGTTEELTVYGPDGGAGTLMCPTGHHFTPPAPIDPVDLLARAVADPRTEFIG